jgi:hypothetical protein
MGPGLLRLMKAGLTGFVLGYLLALFLSQSVWLEMHLNLGMAVPTVTLGFILTASKKKVLLRFHVFLLLQAAAVLATLFLYRFDPGALRMIPACLFREGCGLASLSLLGSNLLIGFILLAGNGIWIRDEIRRREIQRPDYRREDRNP